MLNALRHLRLKHSDENRYLFFYFCAQRLTASKVKTLEEVIAERVNHVRAQRLTASKVKTQLPNRER